MAVIPLVLSTMVAIPNVHNQSLTTINSYTDFSMPLATPQKVLGSRPTLWELDKARLSLRHSHTTTTTTTTTTIIARNKLNL